MFERCGLSEATIVHYEKLTRRFLTLHGGPDTVDVAMLDAKCIVGFLIQEGARPSVGGAKPASSRWPDRSALCVPLGQGHVPGGEVGLRCFPQHNPDAGQRRIQRLVRGLGEFVNQASELIGAPSFGECHVDEGHAVSLPR